MANLVRNNPFIMSDPLGTEIANEEVLLHLTDHSPQKVEEALIRKVLDEVDWKLKRAAKILNIPRGTLYSKMKRYRIKRPL